MVVHPLESSARHTRSVRGALPSIAVHAAIILVAVHATAHAALPHAAPAPPNVIHFVPTEPAPPVEHPAVAAPARGKDAPVLHERRFVAPPIAPIAVPDHLPPIAAGAVTSTVSTTEFGRGIVPASGMGSGVAPEHGDAPFRAAAVDRAVIPLGAPPAPAYPEALRTSGIRGSVTAEFVVDTTGRVEPGSFHALASDNDLFTEAVRTAVLRTRFRPAEAGGRRVRQLVQQSFSFVLQ